MTGCSYRTVPVILGIAITAGSMFAEREWKGKRIEALDSIHWIGSEWISAPDAPEVSGAVSGNNERAADGASWFVSKIRNAGKLVSAKWMTSGLGIYELYVNGHPIGEEILKPGFTHYAKTRLSFTYDITDAMSRKTGAENSFSVQVTPGWWADKIITPGGNDGMYGRKVAFRGVLEFTYSDGTKEYHVTAPKSWKAGVAGPVRHSAIFDGEEYDARHLPVHAIPANFFDAETNREFKGGLFPSNGAEIYSRKDLSLSPVDAYIWNGITGEKENEYGKVQVIRKYRKGEVMRIKPGETLVVDFGQNCAAVPRFVFTASEGTKLRCLPAELLNDGNGAKSRGMDGPEGSVHRLNLRIPETGMLIDYTFSGDKGYKEYMPSCSFFGYRYVSITADNEVQIKSLESVPVTSISSSMESGRIETGSDLINRLISNTVWGMRSNYLSVPTDCPQRNERLGWTADTQVFAETGTYFADTRRFFHKWMRDMRDTQSPAGGFPGVAPFAQYGAAATDMSRFGWADAGVIVPWVIWKQFGDKQIVDENWASMEKYMNHISETRYDHNALLADNGNYQWADWLSYEPLESCSGRKDYCDEQGNWHTRPEAIEYWNYLSASYWLMDAGMMCDMAASTGRDTEKYEKIANEAREYILESFLNNDGTFKTEILNTMQTPALFALKNHLLEGKAKNDMIARLRTNFKEHDNCLQTGFLGTSILMPVLTENGMADIAYELLFQRKNPSWLYSVDNGATTIWERWNSYTIDEGLGPQGMNSFNHYAYGCVCEWMWETMAGISTSISEPGFKRIVMRPIPDKRLGYVKAEYASASGLIKSHWRYDGDKWIWNFTVPEGAVAEVTLPGDTCATEYGAGSYKIVR